VSFLRKRQAACCLVWLQGGRDVCDEHLHQCLVRLLGPVLLRRLAKGVAANWMRT
jgi:hypothetical protein